MSAKEVTYKKGDEVYVFYRMSKRCQPTRKYLAVLDPRHGAYRPRMGISDGWVPARVAADYDSQPQQPGKVEQVSVEYRWPHFYTMRGHLADPPGAGQEPWTEWYCVRDIRPAADFPARAPGWALVPPGSSPELTVVTFRWGGTNEVVAPEQWGETGSPVADVFVDSFISSAVMPQLGNNYEVWTVYIEDASDLVKLADTVHLIFGHHHPVRRAKRTVGMFFLYPTAFEQNCVPNMETGEDHGAAMVDQKSLFNLMKACERAGIPTRFPHPSSFYHQLASKHWTHLMSVVPHLRVPPTVALPRMLVERSCRDAAEKGLTSLQALKRHQAELRGEPPPEGEITKGVAKLSYSWEALDVKFWEGLDGLEEALYSLTQAIEISQEFTGQPHECESVIVQEYCRHDLELRMYVVDGSIESKIYTKFCRIKDNREFGDFQQLFSTAEAARQWMGGDSAALEDGEKQCRELTNHWLAWAQAQLCEMPPAIRFDYFVGRAGPAGKAVVWTLEICELGFSMLGESKLPAKVFQAMLRSCLEYDPAEDATEEEADSKRTGASKNGAAAPKRSRRRR